MKRLFRNCSAVALLALLLPVQGFAQADSSRNNEFVVEITKKIMLADAVKHEIRPLLEPPVIPPPRFAYSFPAKQLEVPSVFKPLNAVNISNFPQNKLYGNYVRLGFGNYTTPLAELYLHNLRSKDASFGFDAKYISQNGKPEWAQYSELSSSLYGTRFFDQGSFGASLNYARNRYNFYGYDHDKYDFQEDSVKQLFQLAELKTSYRNNPRRDNQLKWGFDINYYNFTAGRVKENDAEARVLLGKKIKDNVLQGDISLNYNTVGDTDLYSRIFFNINPRYVIDRKTYNVVIGMNTSLVSDTIRNKFYLYPELSASYQLIPGKLTAFARLTGNVIKNTLRNFARENQFIDPAMEISQAFNNIQFIAGFRGQISPRASFALQFSQSKVSNLHFFLPDSSTIQKFVALYSNTTAVMNVRAELNLAVNEKIRLGAIINFFNYALQDENEEPWHRPNLDFRLNFSYNLGNKLYATAEAYVIGKRYARIAYKPVQKLELDPVLDFNLGLEYRYTKKLAAFVKVNNISSQRYQRWYGYKVYGINGIAGISFTF